MDTVTSLSILAIMGLSIAVLLDLAKTRGS